MYKSFVKQIPITKSFQTETQINSAIIINSFERLKKNRKKICYL